jgi:hypothetical protein
MRAKVEINHFQSKVSSILKWKSLMKGGKSTLKNGWRKQRTHVVLLDGVVGVFKANAHIA